VLEDEDVVRCVCELLIGFITLKGNILSVSEGFHNISMMEGLQYLVLIFEVSLFFFVGGGDYLKDYLILTLPVGKDA
jgi:hypothetical protein